MSVYPIRQRTDEDFLIEGEDHHPHARFNGHYDVERTSIGLRDTLFDALEELKRGRIQAYEAKAIASLAHAICKTVQLELTVNQHVRTRLIEDSDDNLPSLTLGRAKK